MRAELRKENWVKSFEGKNVNEAWSLFKSRVEELIQKHVPLTKRRKHNDPPWMNSDIKKCIEEKKKLWKTWKRTNKEKDGQTYKKKVTQTKRKIRNSKNSYERAVMQNRNTDPKIFYSYVNRAKATRSKIGPLTNDNGDIIVDPKEQAQILNKFYGSVFTHDGDVCPEVRQREDGATLEEIEITEKVVEEVIKELKDDSAAGPDNIPPRLLKELKEEVVRPLTLIFQMSMEEGRIPDDWRLANVTPIFKKGKKAEPGNYRPVSLTNVIGKVMERVVKRGLMEYVEKNKIMANSQHGFRPGRSVQTNLVEFLDGATKWLDEGRSFDVLYLDFSKAFDKVSHKRLLVKLEEAGVKGKVLAWIRDWLRGRQQRVRVDDEYSDWIDVLSSVVQGSVLGGILFDLFIDDIDIAALEALIMKYADDTKVAKIVESIEDAQRMQELIDRLAAWADKWGMEFNVKKCKVLHFGNKNQMHKYYMKGEELEQAKEEKDLGIWIDDTLKPSKQCAAAAKSANFALGQIQRAFHYRKKSMLVPLYKTFVRPRLESSVAAWSPWYENDIKLMERVQERMTRMLSDVKGKTYEERLKEIGLTTLRDRRIRGDMIETFKTLNGFNRVEKQKWFTEVGEEARPTRTNTMITNAGEVRREKVLNIERARLDVRKNFFTIRAPKKWNELPEIVRSQTSINGFKNQYDKWKHTQTQSMSDDNIVVTARGGGTDD